MIQGTIRKMRVTHTRPVSYTLPIGEAFLEMNALVGKNVRLSFTGKIACIHCGRKIKKTFQQGYCFPCMRKLARCDGCIVRPERCHYHLGTCREPEWGRKHCLRPHIVYLANSSEVKVGITRRTNIPSRWIDQGASQALPIIGVSERRLSGLVEVAAKAFLSDKTQWRTMLKAEPESVDLTLVRDDIRPKLAESIAVLQAQYGAEAIQWIDDNEAYSFEYPVLTYPSKVSALNFDKTNDVEGTLNGIKGQYLILSSGVLNLRKFAGYEIQITTLST